jgi:hypothetical protein
MDVPYLLMTADRYLWSLIIPTECATLTSLIPSMIAWPWMQGMSKNDGRSGFRARALASAWA